MTYESSAETDKSLLVRMQREGDAPETISFAYSRGAPPSGPRFVDMGPIAALDPLYTDTSRWREAQSIFDPARPSPEQAVQAPGLRSGLKFLDVDGNGTTDAVYHATGIGTTATHILWEESALQGRATAGLGAWTVPLLGNAAGPAFQPQTGLPFFPLGGSWARSDFPRATLNALADFDGDGDVDGLSLPIRMDVIAGRDAALLSTPPLHAEPVTNGETRIGIVTNHAKDGGVSHPENQVVANWPSGAYVASRVIATPGDNARAPLEYAVEPIADVELPLIDLNADGKTDVVLLKQRQRHASWAPFEGARGTSTRNLLRLYGGLRARPVGDVIDDASLDETVRHLVKKEHALVIVEDQLLTAAEAPKRFVRLAATAGDIGIVDMPPAAPVMMLSAPGVLPAPGLPGLPELPDLPVPPAGGFFPPPKTDRPPWWPVVDPEGDVYIPLKDADAPGARERLGGVLLFGEYRFSPRAYLMRGEENRTLVPEPKENASEFERSLQSLLTAGRPSDCAILPCTYPPHVNFNSFFADVNGDSLPDLVTAEPPTNWQDSLGPLTTCEDGHRVLLNRGYAFERAEGETFPHTWTESSSQSVLQRVANRDWTCHVTRPRMDDRSAFSGSKPTFPIAAMAQADLNGDGRLDLVLAYQHDADNPAVDQQVYLNSGRGFRKRQADLPADIALARNVKLPNAAVTATSYWPTGGLSDLARFVDLDNDGLVDIVKAGVCVKKPSIGRHDCDQAKWYRNAGSIPDRLERVTSTSGAWTEVEYASPKSDIVVLPEGGFTPPSSLRLVKTVRSAAGPATVPAGEEPFPVQETRLSYENFVRDTLSNETLGFETVTAEFVNSFSGKTLETVRVRRSYDVRATVAATSGAAIPFRHPLKGTELSVVTESAGWTLRDDYDYAVEPLGSGARIRPRRSLRTETSPSGTKSRFVDETSTFDPFGNPTLTVAGNFDGAKVGPPEERRAVATDYENRTGREWQIGLGTRVRKGGYSEDVAGNVDPEHTMSEVITVYTPEGGVKAITRVNIKGEHCDGPSDDQTTYEYWPHGLVRASHEAAGRDVSLTYDAQWLYVARAETRVGKIVSGTFKPKQTTLTVSFETDLRTGKTTKEVDPNGIVVTTQYDSSGRPRGRKGPGGVTLEETDYRDTYPLGERTVITTDTSSVYFRETRRDADDHVLSVVEGNDTAGVPWARKQKTRYDAFGRAVESYLPEIVASPDAGTKAAKNPKETITYDGFDRPLVIERPDATRVTYRYEPRQTTETDARGIATRREHNAFGELVRVHRNPEGAADETASHTLVRDGLGAIVRVVDGDGNVRRIERDGAGRAHQITLPARPGVSPATFSLCHDTNDDLIRMESPAGRIVEVDHDELGRPLTTRATDSTGLVVETSQVYDESGAAGGRGRLTSKTDESGTYHLSYDGFGRPHTLSFDPSVRAVAGATNVASRYGATFTYLPRGQLKTVSVAGLPLAAALTYVRDPKGRTVRIDSTVGSKTKALVGDIVYDAEERVTQARYGNTTSAEWRYHRATGRLEELVYRGAANELLASVAYGYDANGNVRAEQRHKRGHSGVFAEKIHTFDALNRLRTSELSHPAGNKSESFDFSPGGNLRVAGSETYGYKKPELPQAVTDVSNAFGTKNRALAYDADGYLSSDVETREGGAGYERQIGFDPAGCLRFITSEERINAATSTIARSDYTCGLDGRVVARSTVKADGSRSRRVDFAGVGEIRPDEGIFLVRTPLGGTVAVEDARSLADGSRVVAGSGYLLNDVRGSVLATTAFDDARVITREAEYDVWGNTTSSASLLASPRHGFAGAEPDGAVGTYSFGARTYDPSLRRWISPDPLLAALPDIDETVGEDLNLYSYAQGNPATHTDKTGFCGPCAPVVAGVVVVVGMGMSAPSDTKDAPANIVGMATSVPGASVVLGVAEKMAGRALAGAAGLAGRAGAAVSSAGATLRGAIGNLFSRGEGAVAASAAQKSATVAVAEEAAVTAEAATPAVAAPPACFVGGTLVLTESGPQPIETIRPGDRVWAKLPADEGATISTVARTFETPERSVVEVSVSLADGQRDAFRATPDHLFWVSGRGWVPAERLQPRERVSSVDSKITWTIDSVTRSATQETVYNLEVENRHTYFAGQANLLVHNGPPCGGAIPDEALVVRGGIATPEQIAKGTVAHRDVPGLSGFSAQSASGATVEQLAANGGKGGVPFPNGKVSVTTAGQLRCIGCDVVRSPGAGANHVTVTAGTATPQQISEAFAVQPNPARK